MSSVVTTPCMRRVASVAMGPLLGQCWAGAAGAEVVPTALLEGPSLYVDDNHALRLASQATVWPGRVYPGIGTNELSRPDCGRTFGRARGGTAWFLPRPRVAPG